MIDSNRGSEWRRWDLHLHTPGTKLSNSYGDEPGVWDRYIEFLENSPVEVFGITDYFCADGYFNLIEQYKNKYPKSRKVFFLNIEFRLSESISKESDAHMHVIFDNNIEITSKEKIDKFLHKLETSAKDESGAKITCKELKNDSHFESASISIMALEKALKNTFGDDKPYLIAFPAKNNGVRSTDTKSPRKVLISDQIDKTSDLFFGDDKSKEYFLRTDRYQEGESKSKPVVSGSDAHSFEDLKRMDGDETNYPPTWIKSDTTFRGLKQICYEPESRVFIGQKPEVEKRKAYEATKFISEINIHKKEDYDETNGIWFRDIKIPINPELTVIIGNKGSGKSAIVDIVGLLGNSRQVEHFSFLSNKTGNRKFKQRGFAENFKAQIRWRSSKEDPKFLDENVDLTKPESVRYLPQNYFEQLTNEIEIEAFRKEIEDVVFSHVDETNRMGKTNFSDLQTFKTDQVSQEIKSLKSRLSKLNSHIVELEEKSDPIHKRTLEQKLSTKQNELLSLREARPQKVPIPQEESEAQTDLNKKLSDLNERKKHIEILVQEKLDILSNQKIRKSELSSLLEKIKSLQNTINSEKEEISITCDKLNVDINSVISVDINTLPIKEIINSVHQEILQIEANHTIKFNQETDFSSITSLPDLKAAKTYIENEIQSLKDQLGAPQRRYQNYLERLHEWENRILEVEGGSDSPQPGTIKNLEAEMNYINNELSKKLEAALDERKSLSYSIFEAKKKVLSFYKSIKKNVEERLSKLQDENFSINIDASFVLDNSFNQSFLNRISKNKKGPFHGSNDPDKVLNELLAEVDFNNYDSIFNCIESILRMMREEYKGGTLYIKNQVIEKSSFYDYLFSLDYISSKYELRSGGKNLNELSPGEKGLLLLIFYLHLDKDNIPLVIDQPEDNLDNDSIFKILSKCIREAKKNRQVILVTHNPNLAVGADAEQIVYVKLNKSENYKFSFESGSIENPKINEKILIVLEGSQPAFVQRRLKYQI